MGVPRNNKAGGQRVRVCNGDRRVNAPDEQVPLPLISAGLTTLRECSPHVQVKKEKKETDSCPDIQKLWENKVGIRKTNVHSEHQLLTVGTPR